MTTIQCHFTSEFTPPKVIQEWWSSVGMARGLRLPQPLVSGEASTCGGYKDNLWLNLELWRNPATDTTICRLSAESSPFEKATVVQTLQAVAKSLQPPPTQAASEKAFASDSFTWMGGWDWTDDSAPNHWTGSQINAALTKAPNGLCASDGSSMGDGTKQAKWGFVDAARRVVYLGFEYISKTDDEIELVLAEGTNAVPISTVPGVSVLRNRTSAYSACLSSDGRLIAQIEYLGGNGYISLVSTADGSSRPLAWFEHAFGGEGISFSPDDSWLLVPSYRGALVTNTETGSHKRLPEIAHSPCWWVREGHLGLLTIGRGNAKEPGYDPFVVDFHDFTTGSTEEVVRIVPPDRVSSRSPGIWGAVPSAQGTLLMNRLVPDSVNMDDEHLILTMLDLNTGILTPVIDIFVEPEHKIRRKQDKWCWNSPIPDTITAPASMLLNGVTQAETSDWPEFEEDKYGAILRVEFGSPLFQVST
jgi:hypothetical protein